MTDVDERSLFAASVRRVFERAGGGSADAGLDDLGWRDALHEWADTAVEVVFSLQGELLGTSSALDDVLTAVLGCQQGDAVVLPPLGRTTPPGELTGDALAVQGLATSRVLVAEYAVVVASAQGDVRAVRIPTALLDLEPVQGVDPAAGLVRVSAGPIASSDWAHDAAADWSRALATAQVALSCELVGVGRAMLALAREHALSRIQFGRPIASFQAVRHRLADTHLAVEAAASASHVCCASLATTDQQLPSMHAKMAKALAGRSARTAAANCQQVLAGIGFTAEHPFHLHLRRALLLGDLLGATRALTQEVGAVTIAERRLPMHLPL